MLEVLPPLEASKRTAVAALLAREGLHRALYAGDDTTDLDAFAALDGLELGVRIAVVSPESPAAFSDRADIVLDSPAALLELSSRALTPSARGRDWRRATSSSRALRVVQLQPQAVWTGAATEATMARLTRYERWIRMNLLAGSAASSSRSEAVARYERS